MRSRQRELALACWLANAAQKNYTGFHQETKMRYTLYLLLSRCSKGWVNLLYSCVFPAPNSIIPVINHLMRRAYACQLEKGTEVIYTEVKLHILIPKRQENNG